MKDEKMRKGGEEKENNDLLFDSKTYLFFNGDAGEKIAENKNRGLSYIKKKIITYMKTHVIDTGPHTWIRK